MKKFKIEEIEDGSMLGQINVEGIDYEIDAILDLEDDKAKEDDYKNLIQKIEKFAEYFTSDKQSYLKDTASKEIIDSALEQSENKASEDDYKALFDDMELLEIYVFEEGFVLTYISEDQLPDVEISIQLNEDYSIEDIGLYEEGEEEE